MPDITIYDNPAFAERYTVVVGSCVYFYDAWGKGQRAGTIPIRRDACGSIVALDTLPDAVQAAITAAARQQAQEA